MLKVVADTQQREGALGHQTLDEVALEGARDMLRHALEIEVAAYLERHQAGTSGGTPWSCATATPGHAR